MKKVFSMFLALCLALALFVACSTAIGRGEPSVPATEQDDENLIYIGVSQPLTGNNATGGNQELLGILYANYVAPSVNIDGIEYEIRLITSDNASSAATASENAKEFAERGVLACLGGYGASESLGAAAVYEELNIPCINTSSTNPEISRGDMGFKISYSDSFQSGAISNFAIGRGFKKAAVLTGVGDAYSESLSGAFTEQFMLQGGEVFSFNTDIDGANYDFLATRIKAVGADFLFMPFESPETNAEFIKQLRQHGLSLPVMGGGSYDFVSLISGSSIYARDVFFVSAFDGNTSKNPITAEFVAKYKSWLNYDKSRLEQNGNTDAVSPFSALGYDAYMVLVEAIKKAETLESRELALSISMTDYEGVTGAIRFDENGDLSDRLAYIKTINTSKKSFEVLQISSIGR
ncbi:MAG: ABC transporter substrate-binding protein [Clostridiales bacterium]|nr:ABC transporter substrate-binding protein [Clostridiales bacterium]